MSPQKTKPQTNSQGSNHREHLGSRISPYGYQWPILREIIGGGPDTLLASLMTFQNKHLYISYMTKTRHSTNSKSFIKRSSQLQTLRSDNGGKFTSFNFITTTRCMESKENCCSPTHLNITAWRSAKTVLSSTLPGVSSWM
jgi:hypothetical protein